MILIMAMIQDNKGYRQNDYGYLDDHLIQDEII